MALTRQSTDSDMQPFIFGFGFDADGKATPLTWEEVISDLSPPYARIWLHLNRLSPEAQDWLVGNSGLDAVATTALLQEDTRPRCVRHGDGFLINLRGVNLNEGADREDMLAVRIWASPNMLITLRAFKLRAVEDVRDMVLAGEAGETTGSLLTEIAHALTNRIEPVVSDFDEQADGFEDTLLDADARLPRTALSEFRRSVLIMRRYIVPQREALAQLVREGDHLMKPNEMLQIREAADRVTRLAEDLDTIRERSIVLQEQIVEQRAEMMNQRLFFLSIVSAVFLPLGFLTGLFGVNVGGMPGMGSPFAFAALCGGLLLTTAGLFAFFRYKKWI